MPPGKQKTEASRSLRNTKQRMKTAFWNETCKQWTDQHVVDDIERQIRGEGFAPEPTKPSYPPQHLAQKQMVEAVTAPAEDTLKGQYRRRHKAIHALIAYCIVEEGRTLPRTGAL